MAVGISQDMLCIQHAKHIYTNLTVIITLMGAVAILVVAL
jgi:hypothetical protein